MLGNYETVWGVYEQGVVRLGCDRPSHRWAGRSPGRARVERIVPGTRAD